MTTTSVDVFYLGGYSDSSRPRADPRRRKFQQEQAEMKEILTWGAKVEPLPRPPPSPVASTPRTLPNRWVTEKMDEFDHTATVVVLSPSRKCKRRTEAVLDLEALVGREEADKLTAQEAAAAAAKAAAKGQQQQQEESAATTATADGSAAEAEPLVLDIAPTSPTGPDMLSGSKTPVGSASPERRRRKKKGGRSPSPGRKAGRSGGLSGKRKDAVRKYTRPNIEKGSSRDLSNTAFARAFDRPIFGPYGSGNIQPAIGGVMYGNYLLSHNIGPEVQPNHPRTKQVFPGAELKALAKGSQPIKPVKFDPKLNERMPLEFLSNIEPKYAALSEFIRQGKEERAQRRAAAAMSSPRHSPTRAREEEEEAARAMAQLEQEYVLVSLNDVPAAAEADAAAAAADDMPPAPRRRGVKPPPPPPADMPPLPADLKNNPKVYKLLPRSYTSAIEPAGVTIKRGESVKDCLRLFD